ncbi:MAG TPA: hypothetical protein VF384_12470 [Planctomycetota bacterium]
MNGARVVLPAEERLLDAALAQLFAGRRRAAAVPVGKRPWLAAALVLLGVAVTAATMWLARGPERDAAQEPAPLPPPVRADGRNAIEALPEGTQHLNAGILSPDDARVFTRLRSLRRLAVRPLDVHVGPINTRKKLPVWDDPPAAVFEPIAKLPALESLQIYGIATPPSVFARLAGCATLRELELTGEHVVVDDAFVQALAAIPALRSLRLDLVQLDAAAVERLARLKLISLHLSRPIGFDADAWSRLCRWPTLETLSLHDLGRSFPWRGKDHVFFMPAPEDMQALGQLTKLRRLDLRACAFRDEHLAALPESLQDLGLHSLELTPEGLRGLKRFGALRRLDVSTRRYNLRVFAREPVELRRECARAIADAIHALRLVALSFTGELTPELQQAIVTQPELAELEFPSLGVIELDALAGLAEAPALRRLRLVDASIPTRLSTEVLAPLRRCRSLRRLELFVVDARGEPPFDDAAVRELLGPDVALHVQHEVWTVKK